MTGSENLYVSRGFNGVGWPQNHPQGAQPPSGSPHQTPNVHQDTANAIADTQGQEPARKKRGRPRKYGPGGSATLALSGQSPSFGTMRPYGSLGNATFSASGFTPTSSGSGSGSGSGSPPIQKRGRGRPPGSGRKQQLASSAGALACSTAGVGFTPHTLTIMPTEDVASKIMAFSQQTPRAICVLSATGSVSSVSLRQYATGGHKIFQGEFDIISLNGSFINDAAGSRNRTGALSIALAGTDKRLLGGSVAGLLVASSVVQVILGSFIYNPPKPKEQTLSNTGEKYMPEDVNLPTPSIVQKLQQFSDRSLPRSMDATTSPSSDTD